MKTFAASTQHPITFPPLPQSPARSTSGPHPGSPHEFDPHQLMRRAVVVTGQLEELLAQRGHRHGGLNE